jgi:ubiquinol-cytochrome c reductase cytochrome c1 subunit
LQGERQPIFDTVVSHGHETQVLKGWQQIKPGTMDAREYDSAVADLVSYMQWMAEPAQNTRVRIGAWVLMFIGLFVVVAWRLNAAYWKDIK